MNAQLLYQNGQLRQAIDSLSAALRDDPTAVRQRTFLFELLCFAGEYERAEKQLNLIASSGPDAEMGSLLYRSALHAERLRQEMFLAQVPVAQSQPSDALSGKLNDQAFSRLSDADPRIGARLEVFVAGQYSWIPFDQIASITASPPQRLRDLLWIPAVVRPGPDYKDVELGEVLIPALTPLAWQHEDEEVRLGRMTDWEELPDGTVVPVGLKLLEIDGELVPILELRELEITPAS
jgi:type VI secretion system protein ImpE